MKSTGIKKLYYSISEVSKITDLEQYVLRYWESEFEQLKPQKNRAGNRVYTNKDIQLILHIKQLLRDERYTIEGAKQVLHTWESTEENLQQDLFGGDTSAGKPADSGADIQTKKITDPKLRQDLFEVKTALEEILLKFS